MPHRGSRWTGAMTLEFFPIGIVVPLLLKLRHKATLSIRAPDGFYPLRAGVKITVLCRGILANEHIMLFLVDGKGSCFKLGMCFGSRGLYYGFIEAATGICSGSGHLVAALLDEHEWVAIRESFSINPTQLATYRATSEPLGVEVINKLSPSGESSTT